MPDTQSIRTFLMSAFDSDSFRCFCFDHFRSVYNRFDSGMDREYMNRLLIEYCDRNNMWTTFFENIPVETRNSLPLGYVSLEELHREVDPYYRFVSLPLDIIPDPDSLSIHPNSRVLHQPNRLFVGRTDALRCIAAAFKNHSRLRAVVAITGMAGIGKTQLASEFVHRYGRFFMGGVFWLSFSSLDSVRSDVVACGKRMVIPEFSKLSFEDQVERVQREWQELIPRLLVFDNCEDEQRLHAWLPTAGGCRVLLTSCRTLFDRDGTLGVQTCPLGVLSGEESIALLRKFCPDLHDHDPNLRELVTELDGLPLALHLVGSYLKRYNNTVTLTTFLTDFRTRKLQHPAMTRERQTTGSPTNHEMNIQLTFDVSYSALDSSDPIDALALKLLKQMACLALGVPVPFPLLRRGIWRGKGNVQDEDAVVLTTNEQDTLIRLLDDLGLLEKTATEDSLRLHRLLAMFIRHKDTDGQALLDVQYALLDYVSDHSNDRDIVLLMSVQQHIFHVLKPIVQNETSDLLQRVDCCYVMGTSLEYTAPDEALDWLDRGLVLLEKVDEETRTKAKLLIRKGSVLLGKEDVQTAYEVLTTARTLLTDADTLWQIRTLNKLGVAACSIGNVDEGTKYYDAALTLCRQIGNEWEQTLIYNNLGYELDLAGKWQKAVESYEQALTLAETLRDSEGLVTIPLNLGILYTNMGENTLAHKYLRRSVETARYYTMVEPLIEALLALADAYVREQQWDEAASSISEAGQVSFALLTPRQQGEICRAKAQIEMAHRNYEMALKYAQQAIAFSTEGSDPNMELGIGHRVLGQVLCAVGRYADAVKHFTESLSLLDGVPYEVARTHLEWGRAEKQQGNLDEAASHLANACGEFERLGAQRDLDLAT